MFDQYKSLMGKKKQKDTEGSIISRSLNFLLRPYKILFKDSSEKPKEARVKSKGRRVKKPVKTHARVIKYVRLREGKVLWKKKR